MTAHTKRTNKTIPLPSDYVPKLEDVMDAIREDRQRQIDAGSEYYPMNEVRVKQTAENTMVAHSITPIASDKDTEPMDFNELIQAGIDEGILPEFTGS